MTKRILIAIPTAKYIEPETFKSIYDLDIPVGYSSEFQFFFGYSIEQIRNLAADWGKKYDYLFFVDSDIVLPRDSLQKLLAADKDIVSGLYIQRIPNTTTVEIYEHNDRGGVSNIPYTRLHGLMEVAACGMGCCLIKGDVLRAIPYPHFVYKSALDHKDTFSEDIWFCLNAKNHGFSTWAECSVRCEHIGNTKFVLPEEPSLEEHLESIFRQDMLPRDSVRYIQSLSIEPKVIYDIGSSLLHWTRHAEIKWPNAKIYLIDEAEETKFLYDRYRFPYAHALLTDEDDKELTFYKDPYNIGGNSYYKETTGFYTESHAVKKKGITLDSLVAKNDWLLPDLIKLDIQGAELDVLRGSPIVLQHCQDIILEAQHTNYNDGAPKVDEVISYLKEIGFNLVGQFSKTEVDGDYHFSRS